MDLFASSVLRTPCVLAVAALLAVAGCVSEKGHAPDAGSPVRLHEPDPDGVQTAGSGGTGVSGAGTGGATAGDGGLGDGGAPDGSAGADPDAQVDGGALTCVPGFVLQDDGCVRDLCEASDDEPAACGDHGACSGGIEALPTCDCDEGYVNDPVECVRNPCIPMDGESGPCDGHATCTYEGEGDASCRCDDGYDGDGESCERNACVQLDDEAPPCADNEDCTPTGDGTKSCACEEDFDDCDDSPDNGCETAIAVDDDNCGVCGTECATGLDCIAGECERRVTNMALGLYASIGTFADSNVFGAGYGGAILRNHAASNVLALLMLKPAIQVSVNTSHGCLVRKDGQGAECWGSNTNYQLGSADADDDHNYLLLPRVRAISAGASHTCVVAEDGDVYCWGQGANGQLGNGEAQSGGTRSYADTFDGSGTPVLDVADAIDVRAGTNISCAVLGTGKVRCWGYESGSIYAPELISNASGTNELSDAEEICVGFAHGCALRADNTIACWGSDSSGQLGSDENTAGRSRWVGVALTDVSAIACGANHTCAVLENGDARCWGTNASGQLGRGNMDASTVPVPVALPDGTQARAVYAGSGAVSTCFELTTGQVYCAGYNNYGQLGSGTMGAPQTTPTEITSWPPPPPGP